MEIIPLPLSDEYPERVTYVGAGLHLSHPEEITFLRENSDVFVWSPADIPGVNLSVITHRLNVSIDVKPIQQRRRNFYADRLATMRVEVEKLLAAGVIRKVQYLTWICNPVLVKKASGDWPMCQDFTDLNKYCPRDCYQIALLDCLVDETAGHELLSFLDALSG